MLRWFKHLIDWPARQRLIDSWQGKYIWITKTGRGGDSCRGHVVAVIPAGTRPDLKKLKQIIGDPSTLNFLDRKLAVGRLVVKKDSGGFRIVPSPLWSSIEEI